MAESNNSDRVAVIFADAVATTKDEEAALAVTTLRAAGYKICWVLVETSFEELCRRKLTDPLDDSRSMALLPKNPVEAAYRALKPEDLRRAVAPSGHRRIKAYSWLPNGTVLPDAIAIGTTPGQLDSVVGVGLYHRFLCNTSWRGQTEYRRLDWAQVEGLLSLPATAS